MAIGEARCDFMPPAVAKAAGLDLGIRGAWHRAYCRADGGIEPPSPAASVGEIGDKALAGVVPPGRRRLGPGDMARAGAVARLAGDVDLRPGRVIAVGRLVVVAPEIRRMAIGAHEVPGLVHPRPMQ